MLVIKVIKESFIKYYDELFKYVLLNLVWFSLLMVPFLLVYINEVFVFVAAIYLIIIAGPTILSGMNYIYSTFNRGEPTIKSFFRGIKENFKRGLLSFLFSLVVYAIFILDIVFFLQNSQNYIMMIVAIFFFYLFILFSMMQIYYWSLLTIQAETGFWLQVKRAFLLVLDNIISSVLIFIVVVIIFILNVGLAFLTPFFLFTLISLISIIMTRNILEKYRTNEKIETK